MKIYHNPRCSKSRQALVILRENGVDPEIIDYLQLPPSPIELARILRLLEAEPFEIARKKETKDLGLDLKAMSHDDAIQAIVDHPKVMERPIVVSDTDAVVGRPPENVLKLL